MAKKKFIKKKVAVAPKKMKRNIVRRTNKKGNAYFYNRRQGKIVSRDSFKKESKRIAKKKEALKKIVLKVKAKVPRKGTKKYKIWRKRYSHLRKCSKVRSIVYELYPDLFPTYSSTAAFCKFFLKRKERATLKNIDAAVKEFTQTLAKPNIPDTYFKPNWYWFDIDFNMDQLRSYVVDNFIANLYVRTQLSENSPFLINEYTYDTTFKAYVDWRNSLQDRSGADRDYTELWVSLEFNAKKTRWEIFIQEEDNPYFGPYTEKIPLDVLVKEEPVEEKGPIIAKGGEGEVKKNKKQTPRKKKKAEPKEIAKPTVAEIKERIENLELKRDAINRSINQLGIEMRTYKDMGEQELFTQVLDQIKEMRKAIEAINKEIISIKTKENGGRI